MKIIGNTSPREIKITLVIWAILMAAALIIVLLLKMNRSRILDNIYFVKVGRGAKAAVLYDEAEYEAVKVLKLVEASNTSSTEKVLVPESNSHYQKAYALFEKAFQYDQRSEFDIDIVDRYELYAQLMDAVGNRKMQLLTSAKAFMARGNYKDASRYIQEANQVSSGSLDIMVLEAQLALLEKRTSEALSAITEIDEKSSIAPKAYWVRGSAYLMAGSLGKSVEEFRSAVRLDPVDLDYRRDLARALDSTNESAEAIQTMRDGLEHGGRFDPAYLHNLGNIMLESKIDIAEALEYLKIADELAPYSGDVQWSLAKAYHMLGKDRLAAATLKRAIEIRPGLQERVF